MCARSHARPVDPANTQLGVAKRVAGDIGYCLGLGPKSATREVAGAAFCPLTRVTPPANVCRIDRSGLRTPPRTARRGQVVLCGRSRLDGYLRPAREQPTPAPQNQSPPSP